MISQQYRLRDVPKGKRIKHFFAYYKPHLFFGICGVGLIIGILSATLRPPVDLEVLWLADGFSAALETEVYRNIHSLEWDTNEDGKSSAMLNEIVFDTEYEALLGSDKSVLLTLLAAEDYSFLLVSPYAYGWMEENDLLGNWEALGIEGQKAEEPVKIPASHLSFLAVNYAEDFEETYLVITKASVSDKEAREAYEKQMQMLASYLKEEGIF